MKKRKESHIDYWQSYSDMMASLLLIFMLIIAVAFVQLQHQKKDYEQLNKDVQKQQIELEEQKKLLKEQGDEYIALKNLLEDKQEQLDKVVGIKAEIIQSLEAEFNDKKVGISLDPKSGSIRFQSEILFATDKSQLTAKGKKYLKKVVPIYLEVLLSEKYTEYISEIIIEGNCDSTGTYAHNLVLSQERAKSVATFCVEEVKDDLTKEQMEQLLRFMNISGRSNKNVILDENNKEDLKASRRVELKFRLKDEQMIEEMLKILEGE